MSRTAPRVIPVDIVHEMQQSYLDYAMSVIVARALPDARDGLKPVQRRLLYAMFQMGLTPDKPHRKSARIVGEVLGKYHPHGDQAVYDALARLAQPFSMRYPLVDGQGNFGSVDGDPPAAMRYTEARLAPVAMELLRDLDRATVDWAPNFDDSLQEPTVLPAALPNLLVNGSTGIAVGMATNIPPHNLGEVVDALVHMLRHWERLDDIALSDLMRFIPGPDFPTGGEIVTAGARDDGLRTAYSTGRGRIRVRGRAHLETPGRGRRQWVVTELPYTVNKARWIEQVAQLVRNGKLQGLTDLRDESDRRGMRVVLALAKSADADAVLQTLFQHTALEITYSIILLALVDGTPRVLSLKQLLRVYLEHRLTVVRRRSQHELDQRRQRLHILEGLLLALRHLDEVIAIIRRSRRAETARDNLRKRFKLSVAQAQAILDMPLRRLAALERKRLDEEYRAVKKRIRELERLLASPAALRQAVAGELQDLKARYGDARRTLIAGRAAATGTLWVVADAEGRLARLPAGVKPKTWGRDAVAWAVALPADGALLAVGQDGTAAAWIGRALPEAEHPGEGTGWREGQAAPLAALLPWPAQPDEARLFTVTAGGRVKQTAWEALPGPGSPAVTLMRVPSGDRVVAAVPAPLAGEALLVTAQGMAIRFDLAEVRPQGLGAGGVSGIKLAAGDAVVAALVTADPARQGVWLVTSAGRAKRVAWEDFPKQRRHGAGVVAWPLPQGARVAAAWAVPKRARDATRITLYLARSAAKRVRADAAPWQSRRGRGKLVVEVKARDAVVGARALA